MASENADDGLPRETVAKRRKSHQTERKLHCATNITTSNNSCSTSDLTPLAACCSSGRSSTETNSLLNSRSRLGSSSFSSFSSESIGAQQRHFSGLPAYIVDIPPIPSLHGLGAEDKDNHHRPGTKSSLSSRSRSASTSLSTSTPEAIRSFKAIRRSASVDLSNL